jgi:hypothetical protein
VVGLSGECHSFREQRTLNQQWREELRNSSTSGRETIGTSIGRSWPNPSMKKRN